MKLLLAGTILGLAALSFVSPKTLVDKHVATLKEAKTLNMVYTVQQLPGSPVAYTLSYSKPNLLSIDGPDRLVQTDGKTWWEFNKLDKTYTEQEAGAGILLARASKDDVWAWLVFFNEDGLKGLTALKEGSTRIIKGNNVTEVTFTQSAPGSLAGTFYFDNKLGIARGVSLKSGGKESLIMASTIELSTEPISPDRFVFKAPAGSKKAEPAAEPVGETLSYSQVAPIFQANCMGCHNSQNAKGRFSVSSYQELMQGGRIIPGNPDGSVVVQYITGARQPMMPKGGAPLSKSDIDLIKAWIKSGAKQ